jgi:hypothetical protein
MVKAISTKNDREISDAGSVRRHGRTFLFSLAIGMVAWRLWTRRDLNLKSILDGTVQSSLKVTTTINVTHLTTSNINMTRQNKSTGAAAAGATTTATNTGSKATETARETAETTNETTPMVSAVDSQTSPSQQEASGQVSFPTNNTVNGNWSVFKYSACCGLGHRLARQAGAYHASHRIGYQLQVDWGKCGERDIFSTMFREETEAELATYVHSVNQSFVAANEVPGTYHANKNCAPDELETNYKFYNELRGRFLGQDKLDNFVQQHLHNKFSLGIHIRDGNGEKGDFAKKKRQIKVSPEEWTERVAKKIVKIVERAKNHTIDLPSPVLFIASDNPRYTGIFRAQLEKEGIPVVHWEQEHPAEGTGVFMGQSQQEGYDQEQCLQKWMDMLLDMLLLGSTDVLIVGQYSSFSQTMPMHLALGKPLEQRKVEKTFCEVLNEGTDMDCHKDQMEWCMNTKYFNAVKTWIPPWEKSNATGWVNFLAELHKDR